MLLTDLLLSVKINVSKYITTHKSINNVADKASKE